MIYFENLHYKKKIQCKYLYLSVRTSFVEYIVKSLSLLCLVNLWILFFIEDLLILEHNTIFFFISILRVWRGILRCVYTKNGRKITLNNLI